MVETKSNSQEWKEFERAIGQNLKRFGLIGEKFTGQLTFHFNDGSVCDIDKLERSLKKRLVS